MSETYEQEEYEKYDVNAPVDEIREYGVKVLGQKLNQQKNIEVIEKNIHRCVKKLDSGIYGSNYRKVAFQIIGDIGKGVDLKTIVSNLKKGKVLRKHPVFTDIKNRIEEHDDFIVNPFEVEEGVTSCTKCGSTRVFTYSKQVRGCDEPMTTFAQCVKCKVKWTYSG